MSYFRLREAERLARRNQTQIVFKKRKEYLWKEARDTIRVPTAFGGCSLLHR
jgi:hypothetical protein